MRTTVDLDEDVLQSAKEIAAYRGSTAGQVISELVRKALQSTEPSPRVRNGVPLLSRRAPGSPLVTTKAVNNLLHEE
jgi:hypothetical protein